jgi:hypothetical protein
MKFLLRVIVIFLGLMAVHIMSVGVSFAEVQRESIVGVWLFDEGNGQTAIDLSKKSTDGKLVNDPKWVNGKIGKAIEFDGKDDYVEIELPDVFDNIPNNDFTIAYWINVLDIAGSGTVWTRILEARNDDSNYVQFDIQINDGEFGINIVNAGVESTIMVDKPISASTWYHVAGVWDADQNSVKLYLDGVPQSANGTTPASPGNQRILNIGRRSDGGDMTYFNGVIDEFAIFNVALTEEEINSLIETGLKTIAAVSPSDKLATVWGKLKNH